MLRNPAVTPGYFGMPEETARVITGGWLHTGDLVTVGADGTYTFVSRIKEVIRRRGENLSPLEVEEVLAQHPAVLECAVVGAPSELTEEEVKAFVVPAPGQRLDFPDLHAFVAGRLAAFKVPRYWQQIEALPRTPTSRHPPLSGSPRPRFYANIAFQTLLWKAMLACMGDHHVDKTTRDDITGDDIAKDGMGADGMGVDGPARTVKRLTDPRALRALAHPTRLALVGLLRRDGPLTATKAGELLGESSASCSFHLRQLAKYGLVEEAGGGTGRERPWQATTMFTAWPDVAEGADQAAASDLLSAVIAERYFEDLSRWLEARPGEPAEWQRAAQLGDTFMWLTADELAELWTRTRELIDVYLDRQKHPELRPTGARMVTYLHIAHPAVPLRGEQRGGELRGGEQRGEEPGQ